MLKAFLSLFIDWQTNVFERDIYYNRYKRMLVLTDFKSWSLQRNMLPEINKTKKKWSHSIVGVLDTNNTKETSIT